MNASRILKALIKMSTETWTTAQNSAVIVGARRRVRHLPSRRDQTPILEGESGDYYVRIHKAADWSGLKSQD